IFDETTRQLVAVADEQHGAGEYQAAVRVYRRALAKAVGGQRRAILRKMLDCCEEIQDEKSALDACLLVAESDPTISFGKYDYLVAQAVVAQARSKDANQSLRDPTDKSRPLFDLARRRLQVFLDGNTGSPEQRKEAGETFAVIDKVLRKEPFVYPSHPQSPDLPDGTAEELLKQARDPRSEPWERGKAAYVAGKKLEADADKAAALAAYRQAFDL